MNKDRVSALNRTLKPSDTTCLKEQPVGEIVFVFNTTIMILTNHHLTYSNSYHSVHAKNRVLESGGKRWAKKCGWKQDGSPLPQLCQVREHLTCVKPCCSKYSAKLGNYADSVGSGGWESGSVVTDLVASNPTSD